MSAADTDTTPEKVNMAAKTAINFFKLLSPFRKLPLFFNPRICHGLNNLALGYYKKYDRRDQQQQTGCRSRSGSCHTGGTDLHQDRWEHFDFF